MKKKKQPTLVTVLTFTTITIIFWVFFSVYKVLTTTPEVNIDPQLLEPINPSLDSNSLNKLEERTFFEEGTIQNTTSQNLTITPTMAIPSPTTSSARTTR